LESNYKLKSKQIGGRKWAFECTSWTEHELKILTAFTKVLQARRWATISKYLPGKSESECQKKATELINQLVLINPNDEKLK
jgi:hypothetical protein